MSRSKILLSPAVALLAFVIYALAVLCLREYRYDFPFNPEAYAIASAVSHIVYDAPLASIYHGVLQPIALDNTLPLPRAIALAQQGHLEKGDLWKLNPDGMGAAYTLFVTGAMALFGVKLLSIVLSFLALVGLSTGLYILRFRDDRLWIIPLYFLGMTLTLFSPLTDPALAGQITIGGTRYFPLLAVLPGFHLFWEMLEQAQRSEKMPGRQMGIACGQMALLLFIILIRGSAASVAAALACIAVVILWRRQDIAQAHFRRVMKKTLGFVVAFLILFYLAVPSHYHSCKCVSGVFWHRVLISLGVNPDWPFTHLNEEYARCRETVPEGLGAGVLDRNGACIYNAVSPRPSTGYGGDYESVIRRQFFHIVWEYPRESFLAFFYYKPLWMLHTVQGLWQFHVPGKTDAIRRFMAALLAAEALLFTATCVRGVSRYRWWRFGGMLTLCSILLIMTYLAAWSVPHTSPELVLYPVLLGGLCVQALVCFTRKARIGSGSG